MAEAEPLLRRALTIDEQSLGKDHPNVARDLNSLAYLLYATNRLAEAEPLMRRQLDIFLNFSRQTGYPHPHLGAAIDNYKSCLRATGMNEEKIAQRLDEMQLGLP